jgi:hypothetical protein
MNNKSLIITGQIILEGKESQTFNTSQSHKIELQSLQFT